MTERERAASQRAELREAIAQLKSIADSRVAVPLQPRPNFDAEVRRMTTGGLVVLLTDEETCAAVADPGGLLQARALGVDAEQASAADAEIDRRLVALRAAVHAEINRRVPIPEER